MHASAFRSVAVVHSDGSTVAVVLVGYRMMTLRPDSTIPVLGWFPTSEELISLMSPDKRRQAVVLPKRDAPRRMTLTNHISMHSRVSRI